MEAQKKAETSLAGVRSQYQNLEKSYDELMERNRRLEVELGKAGGALTNDGKLD